MLAAQYVAPLQTYCSGERNAAVSFLLRLPEGHHVVAGWARTPANVATLTALGPLYTKPDELPAAKQAHERLHAEWTAGLGHGAAKQALDLKAVVLGRDLDLARNLLVRFLRSLHPETPGRFTRTSALRLSVAQVAAHAVHQFGPRVATSEIALHLRSALMSGVLEHREMPLEVASPLASTLAMACDGLQDGVAEFAELLEQSNGDLAGTMGRAIEQHAERELVLQRQAAVDHVFRTMHTLEARKRLLSPDVTYEGLLPVRYPLANMVADLLPDTFQFIAWATGR